MNEKRGTDEPQPIRVKRVKKTTGIQTVCGLSLSQWKDLLFPYLELVELIFLQRTCKALAGYPPLRQIIKLKRFAAFKGIRTESWNKFAPTSKPYSGCIDFLKKHPGKFVVIHIYKGGYQRNKNTIAAFSSKHRMICAILDKVTPHRSISIQRYEGYVGVCHELLCIGLNPLPNLLDFL